MGGSDSTTDNDRIKPLAEWKMPIHATNVRAFSFSFFHYLIQLKTAIANNRLVLSTPLIHRNLITYLFIWIICRRNENSNLTTEQQTSRIFKPLISVAFFSRNLVLIRLLFFDSSLQVKIKMKCWTIRFIRWWVCACGPTGVIEKGFYVIFVTCPFPFRQARKMENQNVHSESVGDFARALAFSLLISFIFVHFPFFLFIFYYCLLRVYKQCITCTEYTSVSGRLSAQ